MHLLVAVEILGGEEGGLLTGPEPSVLLPLPVEVEGVAEVVEGVEIDPDCDMVRDDSVVVLERKRNLAMVRFVAVRCGQVAGQLVLPR